MGSRQTLTEEARRGAAAWAADCAERVLPCFTVEAPDDAGPAAAIARARAFARGELTTAAAIRHRFADGRTRDVGPAAAAAAEAAGQAAAVAHMGSHALGAAAYAAVAAALAASEDPAATSERELTAQLALLAPDVRAALRTLPPLGEDRAGPLGPGLLARGAVGDAIRALQARLVAAGPPLPR